MILRRVAVAVTAALLAAVGLTACSGSDAPKPATKAQLQTVLLKDGDLPSGWTAKAHDSSDDTETAADKSRNQQLGTCLGLPADVIDKGQDDDSQKVYSPDFSTDAAQVSSDAEPDTDSGFGKQFGEAVLTSSKAKGCFTTLLKSTIATSLPTGVTVNDAQVDITKRTGDQPANVDFVISMQVKLSGQGQSLTVYVTEVQLSGKGAQSSVSFESRGEPVAADVQKQVLQTVSDRLAKL